MTHATDAALVEEGRTLVKALVLHLVLGGRQNREQITAVQAFLRHERALAAAWRDSLRLDWVIGQTYGDGMLINGVDVPELACDALDKNPTEDEWNATVRRIAREQIDAAIQIDAARSPEVEG